MFPHPVVSVNKSNGCLFVHLPGEKLKCRQGCPKLPRCSDTCISPELCLCCAVGGVQVHRGAGAVWARGRGAGEVRRALRGAAALGAAPAAPQLRRVLAALLQQVLPSPRRLHLLTREPLNWGVVLFLRVFSLDDLDDYEKHFTVMNYVPGATLKQVSKLPKTLPHLSVW